MIFCKPEERPAPANADKSEVMFVGTAAQLQKTSHIRSVNVNWCRAARFEY